MQVIGLHKAILPTHQTNMGIHKTGEIWINSMGCISDDNAELEIKYQPFKSSNAWKEQCFMNDCGKNN